MLSMPVFVVPYSLQEQLQVIQNLQKQELRPEKVQRLQEMQQHLTEFGSLTDEETEYLQNVLDEYGWMLE